MLLVKDEIHCVLLLDIHLLMTDGLITMYLIIIVLVLLTAFSYVYSLICMLDDKEDSLNHVYTNVETTYKFKTFLWTVNTVVPSGAEDEQVGSVLLWKDLHDERHDLQRVWVLDRWL